MVVDYRKHKIIVAMKTNKILAGALIAMTILSGCLKNADIVHPDFIYQTVYFANQYPVRTVVLGEDMNIDNTLDQQHKVEIKATLGGTRDNKNNVVISYAVQPSLLNNLYFSSAGAKIQPLPTSYYSLASDKITIAPGNIMGGVQVQLTDAFFNDPLAIMNTYALPLKMTGLQNADSILSTKDFVIYALKFVNPWHGEYLRSGKDNYTYPNAATREVARNYGINYATAPRSVLTTRSLSEITYPVTIVNSANTNVTINLILTFDGTGKCTISSGTSGYTVTGTGSFVSKGAKKHWGNVDRDALYLSYQVSNPSVVSNLTSTDTLVMRDRAVKAEYFDPAIRTN